MKINVCVLACVELFFWMLLVIYGVRLKMHEMEISRCILLDHIIHIYLFESINHFKLKYPLAVAAYTTLCKVGMI